MASHAEGCTDMLVLPEYGSLARRAYARTAADRRALCPEELLRPNVKMEHAVRCGLIAASTIEGMRGRIVRLPELDQHAIESLGDYVWALVYANGACVMEQDPKKHGRELRQEAKALRTRLALQMEIVAGHDREAGGPHANLQTMRSSGELAKDLVSLSRLLGSLDSSAARAVVDLRELARAEQLSVDLLHSMTARSEVSVAKRYAIEERRRAFTLFAHAYDQTRRAVSFLRYDEDDADEFVPLLYERQNKKKS